jgi:hypothetical protein
MLFNWILDVKITGIREPRYGFWCGSGSCGRCDIYIGNKKWSGLTHSQCFKFSGACSLIGFKMLKWLASESPDTDSDAEPDAFSLMQHDSVENKRTTFSIRRNTDKLFQLNELGRLKWKHFDCPFNISETDASALAMHLKGKVSRDLHICFLVSFDRSEVALATSCGSCSFAL